MALLRNIFVTMFTALVLTACGGGGGSSSPSGTAINISGSVGDGPITAATVTVADINANIIITETSDVNATYSIDTTVESNVHPLTLMASGGTDMVTGTQPDFTMYSTALSASATTVNITPFTTLVYKIAEKNGGINQANIDSAKTIVLSKLNFGLDTGFVADPISTPISDTNVAHIIKASETLGEMIRRTRDLSIAAGNTVNADDIINSIAADLTDGLLDGRGASGSDAQVAAFANISSAYVAIEAINNRLMVNGVEATPALDNAISAIKSNSTTTTADVTINSALLAQATNAINAVNTVNPDPSITSLKTQLEGISANTLPASIGSIDTSVIDSTRTMLMNAPSDTLAEFNDAVNGATAQNATPVIAGTPAAAVAINNAYSFTPSASDANAGDTLTFSIANMPAWASFNTSTGTLTGTPAAAGTFSDITISVSDGTSSASLAAFSITVSAAANNAPVISGTPAATVTINNAYSFTPTASDADAGDTLTFSITNMPGWAGFDASTGALTGTPTAAGTFSNITIAVSDGTSSVSLAAFSITVSAAANNAPVISGTPTSTVPEDNVYSFTPTASDADAGATLSFSISNKPTWASFNTATGALTGTPGNADVSVTSGIVITVSDQQDSASLAQFNITVTNVNDAPTISGTPTTSVDEDVAYSFTPTASDVDVGDNLTFSIANKPAWASFSSTSGALTGTPLAADVGTTNGVVISVSDGQVSTPLAAFNVTVVASAPTGTGSATLQWTPPTTYTNGDNMNDLDGYEIHYGTQPGPNYSDVIVLNNEGLTEYTISNLPAGDYFFNIKSFTSGTGAPRSAFAGEVTKTIVGN
jgi:plastocyanin